MDLVNLPTEVDECHHNQQLIQMWNAMRGIQIETILFLPYP